MAIDSSIQHVQDPDVTVDLLSLGYLNAMNFIWSSPGWLFWLLLEKKEARSHQTFFSAAALNQDTCACVLGFPEQQLPRLS